MPLQYWFGREPLYSKYISYMYTVSQPESRDAN